MIWSTGSIHKIEMQQPVGSASTPSGEILEVYQADDQPHWQGDGQDHGFTYNSTIGQVIWGIDDTVAGNEPVINFVTVDASVNPTVDPAAPATPLTNTQPTLCVWGDVGAAASYTFIQGGTGITNGTTRFRALTNSLGVDVDINVISPVIDINANVLAGGTFIDISYAAIQTTTSDLYLMNVFSAVNLLTLGADLYGINLDFSTARVTAAADRDIFGYRVALPALAQTTAVTTNYRGFQIPSAGAISDSSTTAFNWYGTDLVLPAGTVTGTATMTIVGHRIATAGALNTSTAAGFIDWYGMDIVTPAATAAGIFAQIIDVSGFRIGTAGALNSNDALQTTNWRGIDVLMPQVATATGTTTVSGLYVRSFTGALLGTNYALNLDWRSTSGTISNTAFGAATVLAGSVTGSLLDLTTNVTAGANAVIGTDIRIPVSSSATTRAIDIDYRATAGTIIEAGIGDTTTLTGALTGMRMNLNTNVTINSGGSLRVIDIDIPAHTQGAAATATIAGYRVGSAGALLTNIAAGTINYTVIDLDTGVASIQTDFAGSAINWRGIDIRSPSVTELAASTVTVIGLDLDMDAVITTGGTLTGINLALQGTYTTANEIGFVGTGDGRRVELLNTTANALFSPSSAGTAVDIAINSLASPIIDIGADEFTIGDFINISYDAPETTTGAVDIFNIFSAANLLTLGGDLTGIRFNFAETRVTPITDQDITIVEGIFPAFTQSAANTTTYRGVEMVTAGALVQQTAAGTINFYGLDLATPAMQLNFAAGVLNTAVIRSNTAGLINADTAGTITWYGFDLTTAEVDADSTGTTTVAGFNIGTAGAINQATGAGIINWYGSRIQMPIVTESTGTITAYGHSVVLADIVSATATSPEVAGYHFTTPADTHSLAVEITYRGLYGSSAGALVQNTAAGEIRWHGIDLVSPASTISFAASTIETAMFRVGTSGALNSSTSGTHNWYGIDLVAPQSTVTGTADTTITMFRIGTAGALEVNTAAGNTRWRGVHIISPVVTETTGDINVFGLDLDMDALVTTGGDIVGINIAMQGTYTTAGEMALSITGDGRTIEIANTENAIDIIGAQSATGLIDLNPSGTTNGTIIDITPSAALVGAGNTWVAINITGNNLDPGGATNIIRGVVVDFSGIDQAQSPAIQGFAIDLPTTYATGGRKSAYISGHGQLMDFMYGLTTLTPIAVWDDTSRTNAIFNLTSAGLIDMNPRGTGSQNVIDITPAVAIDPSVAGGIVTWIALNVDAQNLDPSDNDFAQNIYGTYINFGQLTGQAGSTIYTHRVTLPDSPTGTWYAYYLANQSGNNLLNITSAGLIDINPRNTAAATYLDISTAAVVLTGAPVGINVNLSAATMANVSSTGFSFNLNEAVTHTTAGGTYTHQNTITGGTILVSPASGTTIANWRGLNITMPTTLTATAVITETATINAYGLLITVGAPTLSGSGGTETINQAAIRILDSTSADNFDFTHDGTSAILSSNTAIDILSTGDVDDYFILKTVTNIPIFATQGDCDLWIRPDTGIIRFQDDDDANNSDYLEIQIPDTQGHAKLIHSGNSAQSRRFMCGYDGAAPTLAGGGILAHTGVGGTAWAAGNYTLTTPGAGDATAGYWQMGAIADEILFSIPLPELQVDTSVEGEFTIQIYITNPTGTDRFDYAVYDWDGTPLAVGVDQAIGGTAQEYSINLGALAWSKGDSLIIALRGFESVAPAAIDARIFYIDYTYEVGIENNIA